MEQKGAWSLSKLQFHLKFKVALALLVLLVIPNQQESSNKMIFFTCCKDYTDYMGVEFMFFLNFILQY